MTKTEQQQRDSHLQTMLTKMPSLGQRHTTEQKFDRLAADIEHVPTPAQVTQAVDRLARLERKIELRDARHARRDEARATVAVVPLLPDVLRDDLEQAQREEFERTVGDRFE